MGKGREFANFSQMRHNDVVEASAEVISARPGQCDIGEDARYHSHTCHDSVR